MSHNRGPGQELSGLLSTLISTCLGIAVLLGACTASGGVPPESTPVREPSISPSDESAAGARAETPTETHAAYPYPDFRARFPTVTQRAYPPAENTQPVILPSSTLTSTPQPTRTPTPPPKVPEAGELSWAPVEGAAASVLQLRGLTAPVLSAHPSPDGAWWALDLHLEELGAGSYSGATVILNPSANQFWVAINETTSPSPGHNVHVWLGDGNLAWIQEGKLIIAHADGSSRREVASPEAVRELWLASDTRLFVSGVERLWRLDLAGETWDPVTGVSPDGNTLSSPSHPSSNLVVSNDGQTAAMIQAGDIWKVPLQAGVQAEWLTHIDYFGRGGRISPVIPLDGPYWLIYEAVDSPEFGPGNPGPLLEAEGGRLVSYREVLVEYGLIVGSSSGAGAKFSSVDLLGVSFQAPRASPDLRWIIFPYGNREYIGASGDLNRGLWIEEVIFAWRTEPAAVIVNRASKVGGLELVEVSLPEGYETLLDVGSVESDNQTIVSYPGGFAYASIRSPDVAMTRFDGDSEPLSSINIQIDFEPAPPNDRIIMDANREGDLMVTVQGWFGQAIFYLPAGDK